MTQIISPINTAAPVQRCLVDNETKSQYSCTDQVLGKGHFGSVIQGVDLRTRSPVAIKIQANSLTAKTEAQMVKTLQAPHTVRCRAAFEGSPRKDSTEQKRYVVMDLIRESNLAAALWGLQKPTVRLTLDELVTITRQSLEFLQGLAPIGHFDLKPDNMIFRSLCRSLTILDLGSARRTDALPMLSPAVTHGYSAPEYYLGGKLTPAFDLWSLGVSLYAIVTGSPFITINKDIPKNQRHHHILQLIAAQIGKPSREFLETCKYGADCFDQSLEFRYKITLLQTPHWKDVVKQKTLEYSWPAEDAEQFMEILSKLLRYENRAAPQELLKSPLFEREITAHLEYNPRQKCKVFLQRASDIKIPLASLKPALISKIDITIDLAESVDPCLHIPRDLKGKYIIMLQKDDALITHRISLKEGEALDIQKYQDELAKLTGVKRVLLETFNEPETDAPLPVFKKAKKENKSPNLLVDHSPAASTRSRRGKEL